MVTSTNQIIRKSIAILLILTLLLTGFFIAPNTAQAMTVQKMVTKYHLDIGVQQIWGVFTGTYDANGKEIVKWDNNVGQGDRMSVNTSIPFPQEVSNVKAYAYNASKFKWDEPNYSSNVGSESYYNDNYEDYASTSISVTSASNSGKTVSFSHNAVMKSSKEYNLTEKLNLGQIDQVFSLMAGPNSTNPEADVKSNFPALYTKLNAGRNGVDPNIRAYMYFTPVIIQYDVKEMVEVGSIDADLGLPSTAKIGESFTASDLSHIDRTETVSNAVLEELLSDGNQTTVATWQGTGQKGQNTGGKITLTADAEGSRTFVLTVNSINGQTDNDTKTISIVDGTVVGAKAKLSLPRYTYEGHPVTAEDESTYTVKGVSYSAKRAYEERYATNKFSIVQSGAGTIHKDNVNPIYATAVFHTKGTYNVQLKISPKNSSSLYDTQPIDVLKTPTVTATLGGKQKQNRKQTLTVKVATSPDHPLTTLYATLTNRTTGETVTLHDNLNGSENTLENTEKIKTRSIVKQDSDAYWTNCQLIFLTKDSEKTGYTYKVYAKDTSGNWDSVEQDFTVVPDTPPVAKISVQDTFFRAKESNTAVIEAEDESTTDGDQLQRTWYVTGDTDVDESFTDETEASIISMPGYAENSFGTGKMVQFNKDGVGRIKLRLHVKDVWTEETLPEYITDADYLTAETTAETKVINIAPIVSIKPIISQSLDILLLADGKEEYDTLKNSLNSMQAKLLGSVIDATIKVEQLDTPYYYDSSQYNFYKGQPFAYENGRNTAFEDKCFTVDNKRLYAIEATWTGTSDVETNCSPIAPYTIRAFDGYSGDGKQLWSYTIDSNSTIPVNTSNFKLVHDDTDTYLYFVSGGKTALFTKDNGTLLTVLNFEVGDYSFVNTAYIYTFISNGLYRISRKSGAVKKISTFNNGGFAKRIDGKVQFLSISGLKMKRGIFDAESEQISYETLPDVLYTGYSLAGIDSTGKLIITRDKDTLVYNRSNSLIHTSSTEAKSTPVYNSDGVCNYIASAIRNSSSNYKHIYITVTNVNTGSSAGVDYRSSGDYATTNNIVSALQLDNGNVYVATGAGYYGAASEGMVYDPSNDTANKVSAGWAGVFNACEYGLSSDMFIVSHTGVNSSSEDISTGSQTTLSKKPQTMANIINRYLNKDIEKDKNKHVVGLYSNTSLSVSNAETTSIVQKLKDLGVNFYYLTKQTVSGYGQELANKMGDDGNVLYTPTPAEDLADDIVSQEKSDNVMALKSTADNGYLQKTSKLGLNKQYYYEYDMKPNAEGITEINKDIFKNNLDIIPTAAESILTSDKIEVADVITESFSTSTLDSRLTSSTNNVFTETPRDYVIDSGRTQQGRYGAAIILDHGGNDERTQSATLSFKIPAGQRAMLSFDYSASANTQKNADGTYVTINGQGIYPFPSNFEIYHDYEGKYQTFLSSSGKVDITVQAYQKGKWGHAAMYIDNLQIILMNDTPSGTQSYSLDPGKNNWTTVRGTFRTPASIAYYRGLRSGCSPPSYKGSFYLDGVFYIPAAKFEGNGTLGFTLPTAGENYKIKNLKVYYEENGKKVYAINEEFNRVGAISPFNKWEVEASIVSDIKDDKDVESLVYKKGELVAYDINYYDYESDPSKQQFWRYTHTPYNDGAHPDAVTILNAEGIASAGTGKVLNASIPRFYIDGKYTVEHWQVDDTSRGTKLDGNPLYDKASNIETITFYIVGGASAPWITSISTTPTIVKEKNHFSINVGVDDVEKDTLSLTTEVYKEKKLIFTNKRYYITANPTTGAYPIINTGYLPAVAQAGTYQVVATVRDQTGAGLGTYKFIVVSDGKITGYVNHTDKWDENRKKYNLSWFNSEVNTAYSYSDYLKLSEPRKRGTNVFWSGEKFMLRAAVAGSPTKVTCAINGYTYKTTMTSTGTKNSSGETIYTGSIWEEDMINKWGMKTPEQLTFTFTATYTGGTTKTHTATVIVDNMDPYWRLHRAF